MVQMRSHYNITKMFYKMVLFTAIPLLYTTAVTSEEPQVNLKCGKIRGVAVTSESTGEEFVAFKGIPYAKPPIGELRFKDPQPADSWAGVMDAVSYGDECTQPALPPGRNAASGSENCLFLNVYTRKLPKDENSSLLPVMVWIHGGAFLFGSGNDDIFGPDYLLEKDVVLVTINYRLGVFGFLSLYDPEVPGNMGFKDQVAALRWVKDNIIEFGGDPDQVTIFGESAGGASVQFHTMSPMSKGLFRYAICQSGSALNPWAFKRSVQDNVKLLAEQVGCHQSETTELAKCLRQVPAVDLVLFGTNVTTPQDVRRGKDVPFSATLDDSFLPRDPLQILESEDFESVPSIMGVNTADGMLAFSVMMNHQDKLDELNADFERFVPEQLNLEFGSPESINISERIKAFFFNGEPIKTENFDNYTNLQTDLLFLLGVVHSMEKTSNSSMQYMYQFAHEGSLGIFKYILGKPSLKGVCHADDLGYLFDIKLLPVSVPSDSPEAVTRERMVTMWTNFAKTGNPTSSSLDVKWNPYTVSEPNYLHIDSELSLRQNIEKERTDFWRQIFDTKKSRR